MKKNKNILKTFFTVLILLTIIIETILIISKLDYMYLILMWVPALSALLTNIIMMIINKEEFNIKIFFNKLGFKMCNVKYILIGILFPLIYLLIPYIIYWIKYPNNFAYNGVSFGLIFSDCAPAMFIGIIPSLISALGEEIGWRGFLVPALKEKYGIKKALIISSLFWCIWHFPLIIFDSYMSNLPLYYQLPMFTLCIFPIGVISGLLSLITNSVWPSAFIHAAHNNYDQSVLQIITRGDNMFYYVSETGFLTAICVWIIVVIVLYIKRKIIIKDE